MSFNSVKIACIGLAIAFAFGFGATQGYSEIAIAGGQKPASAPQNAHALAPTDEPLKQSAPLRVQCWQYGVKIIDEKDLFGIRLQNLIERNSLGFKGRDSSNGDIYVIPVNGDSTCLIKPMR